MNKAKLLAGSAATIAVAVAGVAPAFAQATGGPFADVPTDHWAYAAVDKLQKAGVVIGYPDGTYGGKRAMTRYEFAVAIARLLDKIPQPNLSDYYTKEEADSKFATKGDLAGLATKEEVQTLRNLVDEFHTELTTLGVDLDATKKRLAALEGRVTAVEQELKRVKVGGDINFYGIGTNTNSKTEAFRDKDGYIHFRGGATGANPAVGNGNLLAASSVMHDVDLNIKARLSDTATAETSIVFGNYLSYLNSVGSYSGSRTAADRNLDQQYTVYKALVEAPIRLPGIGGTTLTVGRLPMQFTPYTFKLIDVDSYFFNKKTDLGDIPVDGGKAQFNLGPLGVTAFGGKTDPIKYLSALSGGITGTTDGYGLYAGAAHGAYGPAGSTGGFGGGASFGRPFGSAVSAANGAMLVEQAAGARVVFGTSKLGTIGGTYIALAGRPDGALIPGTSSLTGGDDRANINRVYVYGGDVNATILGGLGLTGSYTKSDTAGNRLNAVAGTLDLGTHDKINTKNDAWDAALSYTVGGLNIKGGYRNIEPYFGAPGNWTKVGALTNPTDIKGPYAHLGYTFARSLALVADGQFYEGTGDAVNDGGLATGDKINSYGGGLKYAATSSLSADLGVDYTEYKIGNGAFAGQKPREIYYNIGVGYSFNPSSDFKLLYQIVDFDNKGTNFDPLASLYGDNGKTKGGVAAAQFTVHF